MVIEPLSDKQLAELKDKHGEIVVVQTKAGPCVFRGCTRPEHDIYQSRIFDKKNQSKAGDGLVLSTVVYPEREAFLALCTKYPFISSTCFTAVAELSGMTLEPETKKYSKGEIED